MTDSKPKPATGPGDRRPVASASLSCIVDPLEGSKELAYHTMLEISLSLMSFVGEELRAVIRNEPGVAEELGPTMQVLNEVTRDIEHHRRFVEAG